METSDAPANQETKLVHPKKREPRPKMSDEEKLERQKLKKREWNQAHKEDIAKSTNRCIKRGRDALNLLKRVVNEREKYKDPAMIEQLILQMEQIIISNPI
jgi:hypothetical protein